MPKPKHLEIIQGGVSQQGDCKEIEPQFSEAGEALLDVIRDGVIVRDGDFAYLNFDHAEVNWDHDLLLSASSEIHSYFPDHVQELWIMDNLYIGWMDPDDPSKLQRAYLQLTDELCRDYRKRSVGNSILRVIEG